MDFRNIFKKATENVKVPFVRTIGYEKTYGKNTLKDQTQMVAEYKSWVYACANKNAFSVAKCQMDLFKEVQTQKGGELEQIYQHPWIDLLKNVNPFFNKFELWSITTIFLELTGNAYWWIPRGTFGTPAVIWNIPANWVKIVPSESKFISGYVVKPPGYGSPIPFDEEDIVHFKYPSPSDMFYGASPLMAAAYGVDLNNEIKTWGINFFLNNAQPAGVLWTDDSLTEGSFQRLKDQWNRKHRGSENAGKLAILEQGLKYQQIGSDLSKMQFGGMNDSIRDEILTVYGVPASKLGLVQDVNRANAEANDYTYQKETVLPKLMLIEEKINEKVMPLYDSVLVSKFVSPVPADKEFRLKEQTEHIRSGYSSIDDERTKDNEETYEVPETESPLISLNLHPAGLEIEEPEENSIPDEEDEKEKAIKKASKYNRKWQLFVNIITPQERHFTSMLRLYFREQHSEVSKNLNKFRSISKAEGEDDLVDFITYNMNEQVNKLEEKSRPYITEAYKSGVNLGFQDVADGIDFTIIEPNIARAIDVRIDFFAKKVNESTVEFLRKELIVGVEKGETINEIAKRVDKVFEFSTSYRSKMIARTEVVGATNSGQLSAYTEAGVKEKEWLTALDEKVRKSHKDMQKSVATITQPFITGAGIRLNYPGDRSGGAPAGEIINCRCTVIAKIDKE